MEMNVQDNELKMLTARYVRGEGSAEERSSYEELMLSDDSVLVIYMQVLAELDSELLACQTRKHLRRWWNTNKLSRTPIEHRADSGTSEAMVRTRDRSLHHCRLHYHAVPLHRGI